MLDYEFGLSERITALRGCGTAWKIIAEEVQMSTSALHRFRKANEVEDNAPSKIDEAEVKRLRLLKYSWRRIAIEMRITERSLEYFRRRTNFCDPYEKISDDEVTAAIINHTRNAVRNICEPVLPN